MNSLKDFKKNQINKQTLLDFLNDFATSIENLISSFEKLNKSYPNKYKSDMEEVMIRVLPNSFLKFYGFKKELKDQIFEDKNTSLEKKMFFYNNILLDFLGQSELMVKEYDSTKWKYVDRCSKSNNAILYGYYHRLYQLTKDAKYYFLNYSDFKLSFIEENIIMDIIDIEPLANLFQKYKLEKETDLKEEIMTLISNKIVFLWDAKNEKNQRKILKSKIDDEKLNEMCGNMHGYFRHTSNDSRGKEAQEWKNFTDIEKIKIMDTLFIDISYCLAILRNNDALDDELFK